MNSSLFVIKSLSCLWEVLFFLISDFLNGPMLTEKWNLFIISMDTTF